MATLQITDNRPSGDSHADGKAYFETSTNKMLVWNATAGAWIELDPDGTGAVPAAETYFLTDEDAQPIATESDKPLMYEPST